MSALSQANLALLDEIKALILQAAVAVNAELTLLYWQVGRRIASTVLKGERGEYGKQVIEQLATELMLAFGRGWSKQQLRHCLRFAETFPDLEIVSPLWRQLSWSHFKALIYVDDALKREFYLTMALQERWSTRTLAERIDAQLYERTAISKKPEQTIRNELTKLREEGPMSAQLILTDPYVRPFYLEQKAMPNLQQLVGENPRGQALRKALAGGEV